MIPRQCFWLSGVVALLAPFAALTAEEAADKGVEVLARGPVHEAFAEPLEQKPAAGPVHPKRPPAPIDELPPDQKPEGDSVVWLPGYWSWDDDRADYIWVSGFWRTPPPNRAWMPGSWRQVSNGWQWVGGFWGAVAEQKAEIQYLSEPPATLEAGPTTPAPSDASIYVPGCWVYRSSRYMWRPGVWVDYKPGWMWIPAHYRWTPCGYVFVDGYWDYPLASRGMLFAPVYIPQSAYVGVSYTYTPTIVVQENCMYGALFVRGGRGCYYFGDYFGPTYATAGYTSWVGYSCGGNSNVVMVGGWYDPMYSYYRVSNRNDPSWSVSISAVYVGRYRGDIAPPPRTLVQQNTIINNNTTVINNSTTVNNTTVNNTNINNKTVNVSQVQMLTPISQAAKTNPNLKLQSITPQARQDQQIAARQINVVGQQRNQLETRMVASSPSPPRVGDPPRSLKMDATKTVVRTASAEVTNVKPASSNQAVLPVRTAPVTTSPVVPIRTAPVNPATTGPMPLPHDPTHPALIPNVNPVVPISPVPKSVMPPVRVPTPPLPPPPPPKKTPPHDKN